MDTGGCRLTNEMASVGNGWMLRDGGTNAGTEAGGWYVLMVADRGTDTQTDRGSRYVVEGSGGGAGEGGGGG